MSKKILFCATVDYHFKAFHLPIMKWFKEQGWEVHVAASGEIQLPFTDQKFNIPIQRTPFSPKNLDAYTQMKTIIEQNHYSIIHCHTPLGGVLTRLAAKRTRDERDSKVIYTAHGFHFCKGSPFLNWLIYYPIEKYLASYTDTLITINVEDYQLATSHKFKAAQIKHVHGVGVDINKFKPIDEKQKKALRFKLGIPQEEFLLFYAAEFNKNKNQQLLIKVIDRLKDELPLARLLLAGEGPMLTECKKLASTLQVADRVHFLGFRKDIDDLLQASDVAVGSSFREGLPVNIMEAMACGLPVIATKNRGHKELIRNGKNGWVIEPNELETFAGKILYLSNNKDVLKILGMNGRQDIAQRYSTSRVVAEKSAIYRRYMNEKEERQWMNQ
ncbi:MAG: glycosyltransferase family 4 protein [Bacillaceae bacterium]|nr:glycosyltransferase family 4 protein [Bacillaceae bacterium]